MSGAPFVSGDRVTLRTVDGEEDYDFIVENVNRPAIRRTARPRRPQTRAKVRDRVEADDRIDLLAWDGETPVGRVSVREIDPVVGLGTLSLWITPEHQDAGYGEEALALMIEYAFEDLALRRLEGYVLATNEPARAIVESLGFTHEGTQRKKAIYEGEFVDLYQYGLLAGEYE